MKTFLSEYFIFCKVRFWKIKDPDVILTEELILHNPPADCVVQKKLPKPNRLRRDLEPFNLLTHKLWGGATIKAAAVVMNRANTGGLSNYVEFTTPEGGALLSVCGVIMYAQLLHVYQDF